MLIIIVLLVLLFAFVEDWLHTDRETERRINEVLSYPKLVNAADRPELYAEFQRYVKTSLKNWIPERDFPKIGYLPKEFLFDRCLAEKEIIKYWPEASLKNREKYVALTLDEVISNYESILHDLLKKNQKQKDKETLLKAAWMESFSEIHSVGED